jgi:hypothetical protein
MPLITPERKQQAAKMLGLCKTLSKRWRISVSDVARIANAIAQSEIDPLYTIHGHEFAVFSDNPKKFTARFECDFEALSIPPEPFERCNLLAMLDRYEHDSKNGFRLMSQGDEDNERVLRNQLAWARFFAVRHPHPLMREWFQGFGEALKTGRVVEYTMDFLERCREIGFEVSFDGKGSVVSLKKVEEQH